MRPGENENIESPEQILEHSLQLFCKASGELARARAALQDVENRAQDMGQALLEVKGTVATISIESERMIALFRGRAERAHTTLNSFFSMALQGKFPRNFAQKALTMAKEFDSTALSQMETRVLELFGKVETMKADMARRNVDLHPLGWRGQAAAAGGGAALGASLAGLATFALGGLVLTTGGLVGVVLGVAALVGFLVWGAVKLYEESQQTRVTRSFRAAIEHCENALALLEQLQDRISKANTGVQAGKETLSAAAASATDYASMEEPQFNSFMADQLATSVKQMQGVIEALTPPQQNRDGSWRTTLVTASGLLIGAAVTTAVTTTAATANGTVA